MKNNSGILGKFNLIDWWFNEFSPETQNYILEICENSTSMHDNLLTGKVNTNMSATHFLWSFASRVNAYRIVSKNTDKKTKKIGARGEDNNTPPHQC
jgi:hypothetical protein